MVNIFSRFFDNKTNYVYSENTIELTIRVCQREVVGSY